MDLLAPDPQRIGLPAGAGQADDRVPAVLAGGTPQPLRSQLIAEFGADRVHARVSDLVRYASDASPYRLLPQAVIEAHDAGDVAKAFAFGRRNGIPVTLRSGGTSLNGQGQGAGLLVDVRKHFRGVRAGTGTVSSTASAMNASVPSEPTTRRRRISTGVSASRNAHSR